MSKSVAKPNEIPANEGAKRLGLTAQAVGQWASRPGAPARKDGTRVWLIWPDFARWREGELVKQAKAELAPTVSLAEARTRKALAEAELAELEVAKSRGEFVAVADYAKALARVINLVTARIRAMPPRLSYLGPQFEAAVEGEGESIIVDLSQMDEDVIDEPAETAKEAA
jgi:hypothetical protein